MSDHIQDLLRNREGRPFSSNQPEPQLMTLVALGHPEILERDEVPDDTIQALMRRQEVRSRRMSLGFSDAIGLVPDDAIQTIIRRRSNATPTCKPRAEVLAKNAPARRRCVPSFDWDAPDIADGLGKNLVKKNYVELARYALDHANWMASQGTLYFYDERYWRALDDHAAIVVLKEIFGSLIEISDVLIAADYKKIYCDLVSEPDIQVDGPLSPPEDAVNLWDGVADLSGSNLAFVDQAPDFFFRSCLNVSVEEITTAPYGEVFEAFISRASNGDPRVRTLALEAIACALVGRQVKKSFYICGPTGTGKSVLGRLLLELLGRANVETIRDINDFGERWTVGSLAGKALALCLDLPNEPIKKRPAGLFKQFVGLDPIKGELKMRDSTTIIDKPTLLMCGNFPLRMPRAEDDEAFWDRIAIIPFGNPVDKADRDDDLVKRLFDERAYIIREAMQAYLELKARNFSFSTPEIPAEYRPQESDPLYRAVRDFVERFLEYDPNSEVSCKDIYQAFCAAQPDVSVSISYKKDGVPPTFGRSLQRALRELLPEAKISTRIHGKYLRGYQNVSINEELV